MITILFQDNDVIVVTVADDARRFLLHLWKLLFNPLKILLLATILLPGRHFHREVLAGDTLSVPFCVRPDSSLDKSRNEAAGTRTLDLRIKSPFGGFSNGR